jgi:hypothetical protein
MRTAKMQETVRSPQAARLEIDYGLRTETRVPRGIVDGTIIFVPAVAGPSLNGLARAEVAANPVTKGSSPRRKSPIRQPVVFYARRQALFSIPFASPGTIPPEDAVSTSGAHSMGAGKSAFLSGRQSLAAFASGLTSCTNRGGPATRAVVSSLNRLEIDRTSQRGIPVGCHRNRM